MMNKHIAGGAGEEQAPGRGGHAWAIGGVCEGGSSQGAQHARAGAG